MTDIFIDTNIILHFRQLKDIDWLKECGQNECTIILSPIVLSELDEKKYEPGRKGKKARAFFSSIVDDLLQNGPINLRPGVSLTVTQVDPVEAYVKRQKLSYSKNDHRLIATIDQYKYLNPLNNVFFYSNDRAARMLAKGKDIECLSPNPDFALAIETSEEEKEIKKLREELADERSKRPRPVVLFRNGNEMIELEIKPAPFINREEFIEEYHSKIRDSHPLMHSEKADSHEPVRASLLNMQFGAANKYNEGLNKFLINYRTYLNSIADFLLEDSLTYELTFVVKIEGSAPAYNLDVDMHFPDGFALTDASEQPKIPNEPKPPYKPKNAYDSQSYYPVPNLPNIERVISANIPTINFKGPIIKKGNSYEVNFYREFIKHHHSEGLGGVKVTFASADDIKDFIIDYRITEKNLPDPIARKFMVKFK